MLISFIIPVFNCSDSLKGCLRSLLPLLMAGDAEAVVVDDGSDAEEAGGICCCVDEMNEQLSAVVLVRIEHRGASAARNAGVEVAEGRFVWFFDSDDRADPDTLASLMTAIKELPSDAELFHTGAMKTIDACPAGMTGPTVSSSAADILAPKSGCLDHTTYIISRRFLQARPELRYAEGRSLLEDSVFVLRLLDAASVIYVNESLRPYIRVTGRKSLTAGPWSQEMCRRWMPDIEAFFDEFTLFVANHSDYPYLEALYRRYCYLYLRVLAVKGCPWSLLRGFHDRLQASGYRPSTIKERLLNNIVILYLLSTCCRLLR
ncbi:MAG: glycosyltransferase family 2 protein [Bacteroidales bacterium]|nr:glycosyltransferase family 2 protein [Bacteroidales bacterium]